MTCSGPCAGLRKVVKLFAGRQRQEDGYAVRRSSHCHHRIARSYASMYPTLLIYLLFAGFAELPSSGRNFREITGGVTEGK
jgi:hypothetical protein